MAYQKEKVSGEREERKKVKQRGGTAYQKKKLSRERDNKEK